MDFDLRDWLLVLGPVFVAVVLLHGYWRMRRSQGELRMALDKSFITSDDVDDLQMLKAELPNGGARVLGDGNPKIGAHGKPVLFLHPKDFNGTLVELEQA